jgi:cobalamin biosynthesis Mg chelatase CobN
LSWALGNTQESGMPQLGILAAYAVVLLILAVWRLRRVLSA